MLTVQEVAEMKGVDARTVRGWIQRGLIVAEQINPRLWLIVSDSVEDFNPPKAGRPSNPKAEAASGQDGRVVVKKKSKKRDNKK